MFRTACSLLKSISGFISVFLKIICAGSFPKNILHSNKSFLTEQRAAVFIVFCELKTIRLESHSMRPHLSFSLQQTLASLHSKATLVFFSSKLSPDKEKFCANEMSWKIGFPKFIFAP